MSNHHLLSLAARTNPTTKTAARAALKAAGLKQTLAPDLLSAAAQINQARSSARQNRIIRRLGHAVAMHRPTGRLPVRLRPYTLAQRLYAKRQCAVLDTLLQLIDHHRHGAWRCELTDDPACVGVKYLRHYTGEKAGKWAIEDIETFITVPTDWRVRVQRRGLAIVDGMMTLDASPLEAHGCELYAAVFARRTGAKNVAVERGYIARSDDGISYHGATAEQALTGLAKKRRQHALIARLDAADLSTLVDQCRSATVHVGDARATGACVYGIRSWCATVGLPTTYDEASGKLSGSAPLAQVYAAYQREPRPEARATILRVLRRQRHLHHQLTNP